MSDLNKNKKDEYEDPGVSFADMSGLSGPRFFGRRRSGKKGAPKNEMPSLTKAEKRAMRRAALYSSVVPALLFLGGFALIFLLLYVWLSH
ncbi:MAG: hypothetical protein LBL66_09125 [Clostridiales bacterium]|jgi:hypothetical protein|nr:hypothetical protein [Clostridiales bacterium]